MIGMVQMVELEKASYTQSFLQGSIPRLNEAVDTLIINHAGLEALQSKLSIFTGPVPIGIAGGYDESGKLTALAFCVDGKTKSGISSYKALIVERLCANETGQGVDSGPYASGMASSNKILQDILARPMGDILSFDVAPLVLAIHDQLSLDTANAIDLLSLFDKESRDIEKAIRACLGTDGQVTPTVLRKVFPSTVPLYEKEKRYNIAFRAWLALYIVMSSDTTNAVAEAKRIDTRAHVIPSELLRILKKINRDASRLDLKKPTEKSHTFNHKASNGAAGIGQIGVRSAIFKDRIRAGKNQTVRVTTQNNTGKTFAVRTAGGGTDGRDVLLSSDTNISFADKLVQSITTVGHDDPTKAEVRKAAAILSILDKSWDPLNNPWIQNIYSSVTSLSWPAEWTPTRPSTSKLASASLKLPQTTLNASQQEAVSRMFSLDDKDRLVIVQGPPGTGKTSVIAQFVLTAVKHGRHGIWLVAQSNVAVKNIAEKLLKVGFTDWRLLLSYEFVHDWHDHLYTSIPNEFIIQSKDFFSVSPRRFGHCHVFLATLSMLSSYWLKKFTKFVPINTLVVDEASQIEVGDYFSPLNAPEIRSTLRKMVFIGDDRQLPPFGQEDLKDLKSIFEVEHLSKDKLFLNIQYRMPPQIGQFISDAVYDGKLNSNPKHPVPDTKPATYFISVSDSKEKFENKSFKNFAECNAAIILAQYLQDNEKSYRIITPYDAQRNLIETTMKEKEGLQWGDKCFNVDSFQGNEDDYIIISLVRSNQVGFLKDLRRTNVMLTRCKRGMFVICNRPFLESQCAELLMGKLGAHVGSERWITVEGLSGIMLA